MSLKSFNKEEGPHLTDMLMDFFLQLRFRLEQGMHMLADHLELIGFALLIHRHKAADLIQEELDR